MHLTNDVATTDELAIDEDLGNGRPLRVRLDSVTDRRIGEHVHGLEGNPKAFERFDGGRRKSTLRKCGRAFHINDDLLTLDGCLDGVLYRHWPLLLLFWNFRGREVFN